ncbi:TniQ family protein [Colwellia sp. MB02u-10]|uniref:TniQ family protein n=1 Tax=Colwellia sp. MB02u-10 TaxID=2759828 RepID=UPI002174E598|nr:TniQ family protein [Colwellia sp. MB02u-10]
MIYDDIQGFAYQFPIHSREHFLGYFFRLKQLISNNVDIELNLVKRELSLKVTSSDSQNKVCNFLERVTRKDDIAACHSLYPFYQKFYAIALNGNKHRSLPRQSDSILNVRRWRWCSLCVEEDKKEYGVSTWHTNHQNPLVHNCDLHQYQLLSQCRHCRFEVTSLDKNYSPPKDNRCPVCGKAFSNNKTEEYCSNRLWLDSISQRLLCSTKMIDLNSIKGQVRNEIGVEQIKLHYQPKEKELMRKARLDYFNTCHSKGVRVMFQFNTPFITFQDPPAAFSLTKVVYWEPLLPPIVYLLLMRTFLPESKIESLLFDL